MTDRELERLVKQCKKGSISSRTCCQIILDSILRHTDNDKPVKVARCVDIFYREISKV
jgi:hypothetical protein